MTLQTQGFEGSVTLSDQGGRKSTLRFDISGAADAAAAAAAMSQIVTALAAITNSAIVAYSYREQFEEDTTFLGTGQNTEYALIVARIDVAEEKYANLRVINPVDGIFIGASGANYNRVDPNDADLISYLSLFETGSVALVSDGESLADVATAGNVEGKRVSRGKVLA